ncbi:accessory Sec system protein Asp3 [Macrococcus epidermidis]|uniref:accessory Sec system protein Asp3 n=1 Tax=Macrococcus epidermidis TaxID=1902580 RepID=UPI001EF23B41|nr:accessory Sec system protein Asp3 [Macrococcus epidermidis]MCG7421171.1 accessory Sec system protein Asp3 [Macrococcus epidermidis]
MIDNKFIIQWKHIEATTFMYGTTLSFDDNKVKFKNELMPAGTVIHSWMMTSAYFRERHIPSLPILKRNKAYHIKFNIEETPANSVYFKLSMYRRNKSLIEAIIFNEKEGTFTYSEEAYYYEIEMLSASVKSFEFESITIEAISNIHQLNCDEQSFNYNNANVLKQLKRDDIKR